MMKSIVSMLAALAVAFLHSSPAQAGYADGMNQYAGYHVMRGGVDPMGLQAGPVHGLGQWHADRAEADRKLKEIVGSALDSMSNDVQPTTRTTIGIDKFVTSLKGAIGGVTFRSGGVTGNAIAQYAGLSNEAFFDPGILKRGKFTVVGRTTAMHEMVHALDDAKDWYIKPFGSEEKAEALAYG